MTLLSRIDFGSSPEENGQNGRHKAGRPTLLPSVNSAGEPEHPHHNGNSRDDRADFQGDFSEILTPSGGSEPLVPNGHTIQDEGRRPRVPLPHRPRRRKGASLPPATVEASWPEMYRELYVSLGVAETAGCVIGVTSSTRGEGRTTVALGLASTLAGDLDCDVLLVDADLDNPSLAHELGIPAVPGLPEVLRGDASILDVSHQVSERLFVVSGGENVDDTAGLLRSIGAYDPFSQLRDRDGVTVVDLPPVLGHGYTPLAASAVDALVMVIRAGATPAGVIREALDRLKDQPPRGAVLVGEQPVRRFSLLKRRSKSSAEHTQ